MADLQPYWPYIIMALNGLVAGWLAGLILGGGGLIRNLFVGILGSFLAGSLVKAGLLRLPQSVTEVIGGIPYAEQVVMSTIGALMVIILARLIAR